MEVEITRFEVIVVADRKFDDKGNLVFTDKGGKPHKLSPKRNQFFDLLQTGMAVKLNYSKFKDIEYIYSVEAVKDLLQVKPEPAPQAAEPKISPVKPNTYTSDGKNRAFALSYAKDWTVALLQSGVKTVSGTSIMELAKAFEHYLNTGEIPESKVVTAAKKAGATKADETGS